MRATVGLSKPNRCAPRNASVRSSASRASARAGGDQNPPLRLEFRPGAVGTPASDALRDGAAVAHGHRERHTPRRLVRAHHLTRRRGAGAQRERHAVPGEERERAAGRAPLRDERFRSFSESVGRVRVKLAVERVGAERRQADAVRRARSLATARPAAAACSASASVTARDEKPNRASASGSRARAGGARNASRRWSARANSAKAAFGVAPLKKPPPRSSTNPRTRVSFRVSALRTRRSRRPRRATV